MKKGSAKIKIDHDLEVGPLKIALTAKKQLDLKMRLIVIDKSCCDQKWPLILIKSSTEKSQKSHNLEKFDRIIQKSPPQSQEVDPGSKSGPWPWPSKIINFSLKNHLIIKITTETLKPSPLIGYHHNPLRESPFSNTSKKVSTPFQLGITLICSICT